MATKKIQTVTVKKSENKPEPTEIIAQSIIEVAEAAQRMRQSRLTQRAIILLIKDSMPGRGIGLDEIKLVLDSAAELKNRYIK